MEGAKGEHAFDFACQLRDRLARIEKALEENLANADKEMQDGPAKAARDELVNAARKEKAAVVPDYIRQAIRWACGLDEEEVGI